MTHLHQIREGATLAGIYTLNEWLAGDQDAALFQASTPEGTAVVIKTVTAGGSSPLDVWHRTRHLRHPNLAELLDCGQAELGGDTVYFAVFEAPDDTLAAAVRREPLDSAQSREVLDAALDALRYLHAQGLVIGVLDLDHVVAVGDRIKLATSSVREAETSAAYREDVRLLGDLWHDALMSASADSEALAAHAADPDPKTRWTLAELHAALHPPDPPAAVVPPMCVEEPVPIAVQPEPAPLAPSRPPIRRTAPVPVFRFPRWILMGVGLFLLILLALNRPRHADTAVEPQRVAPTPAPAVPLPPPPAPSVTNAKSEAPPVRGAWRVIAFTYRSRDAAEKKAQRLNHDHPGLNAAVFSPSGQRGYYLVSLGGRMSREDAVRLQRSARSKGLPPDLYVQNYAD